MSSDKTIDPERLLPPLDAEPGPAQALDAERAAALASLVVRAWSRGVEGLEPADSHAGPAEPLSDAQLARVVRNVTWRHRLRAVRGLRELRELRGLRGLPWKSAAAVLLALSVGSAAFAALRVWEQQQQAVAGAASGSSRTTPARRAAAPRFAAPVVADAPAPQPTAAVENSPTQPPTAPSTARAREPARSPLIEGSASLLARANAARAKREWADAERLYLRVLSGRAQTHERYVATLAAASLALEHTGKPQRALALYEDAVVAAPSGDLAEEARYGVAQAYRALGVRLDEARALREFLQLHPRSLHAPLAAARLRVLDQR